MPAGARSAAAPAAAPVARPSAPVPPLPALPPHPSLPLTDLPYGSVGAVRRTGPVPPLPGTVTGGAGGAGSTRRPRPVKPPRSPGRRRLLRVVVVLAAVVGLLALYDLGLYFYVDRSIDRVDALAVDGPEIVARDLQDGAQTYLVVGTGVPGQEGARSVTGLLATVSRSGDRAVLLSLPPTALVDTPQCRTPGGDLREPRTEALASALLGGGPSCLVRVVQQISGMQVDHYLALDLARLPDMVDALGDVPVCVPSGLAAAAADRSLPLGRSSLGAGEVAGWLRPGEHAADDTGLLVSERTQLLLTSTLRAALTAGTLADPVRVTRFLSRAADALTVDSQTTLGDLRELASSLGDLSGSAVQQAELPATARAYVPAGAKTPYVLLDAAGTGSLFETVIRETKVPGPLLEQQARDEAAAAAGLQAAPAGEAAPDDSAATAAPADPAGPQPLTVAPADVTVDVLNATDTSGLAGDVAEKLKAQGFTVGTVDNESAQVATSIVRHGPDSVEQARTVAAAVPGAQLKLNEALVGKDGVQLVLGPGYTDVATVQVPAAAPEPAGTGGEQAPPPTEAPAAPAAPAVSCG